MGLVSGYKLPTVGTMVGSRARDTAHIGTWHGLDLNHFARKTRNGLGAISTWRSLAFPSLNNSCGHSGGGLMKGAGLSKHFVRKPSEATRWQNTNLKWFWGPES